MSCYINFLVRHDFHECSNLEKAHEYATRVFNKVKQEWVKSSLGDECAWIDTDAGNSMIYLQFGDSTEFAFYMNLYDGYWAVETNIDDYWLSYHVGDDVINVYFAPLLCKFICNALGQQEAWICFEDRLENSDDAPRELNAWFEYAEKVGIRDVTLDDFRNARNEPGKETKCLIDYDTDEKGFYISGTSHPILHFTVSGFEELSEDMSF